MKHQAGTQFCEIIKAGSERLAHFTTYALVNCLEPVRLARASQSLLEAGVSISSPFCDKVIQRLRQMQHTDGGWSDPEETAWCASVIGMVLGEASEQYSAACKWLDVMHLASGGWGKHSRDRARITITGLIGALLPNLITTKDISWIEAEWQKDLDGPTRLSYKAGFFLLAMACREPTSLTTDTIDFLYLEQNDNGGFSPWKGHPLGSDPWSTGVVLWGLSKWPNKIKHQVLERALHWLASSQLSSGYWPYHYLDDGTSLALIGAVSAIKCLAKCAP